VKRALRLAHHPDARQNGTAAAAATGELPPAPLDPARNDRPAGNPGARPEHAADDQTPDPDVGSGVSSMS